MVRILIPYNSRRHCMEHFFELTTNSVYNLMTKIFTGYIYGLIAESHFPSAYGCEQGLNADAVDIVSRCC